MLSRSLLFAAAFALFCQTAFADWQIAGSGSIPCNTETTLTLHYDEPVEAVAPIKEGTLWLVSQRTPEVLMPQTVSYSNSTAAIPVFVKGEGDGTILLYDDARKSTSALLFQARNPGTEDKPQWLPQLKIEGDEEQSIVSVNIRATATLSLTAGAGAMPPSAHISVTDHRGRVVSSRFHNTFDLVAGQDAVQIPAAGQYEVNLKLLNDPLTSLPSAIQRDPEAIAFGETAADIDEPAILPEGVTTQTVLGVRVALEHIPTTATIVGGDRLSVVALALPSKEIQKNSWPFVIAGADLISMPFPEMKERGPKLARLQRRLGSSFAPVDLEWSRIQKSPGWFRWSSLNMALPIYRKAIVRPLLTVRGKSAWSQQLPTETSATLEAWTNFTRQLSEKHRDLIWGLQCWKYPKETWSDPGSYGRLIDATLKGFQMPGNQRVPTPPVVIGGLRDFDIDYLEPLLTSETISRTSGVSFDLYPKDKKQSPESNGFVETLDKAAQYIKDKAASEQLWITGTGWPNSPEGVTEKLQANYLVRTHVMALTNGIYKLYWNSLMDRSELPWHHDPASRMGLLDDQLFPKASGVAYNLMTYMMSGVEPIESERQGSVNIYKFNIPLQNNKWPGLLYVAWTESPGMQDIQLDMTHGGGVYALDYLGAEVQTRKISGDSANSIQGSYNIPVGFEPVFIWDAGKPGETS